MYNKYSNEKLQEGKGLRIMVLFILNKLLILPFVQFKWGRICLLHRFPAACFMLLWQSEPHCLWSVLWMGVGWIFSDGDQVVKWSLINHWFKCLQVLPNYFSSFADPHIDDPAGISSTDAASPGHHSTVDGTPIFLTSLSLSGSWGG